MVYEYFHFHVTNIYLKPFLFFIFLSYYITYYKSDHICFSWILHFLIPKRQEHWGVTKLFLYLYYYKSDHMTSSIRRVK